MSAPVLQTGGPLLGAAPEWLVPLVLVVTELGNVGVLLALFALDYWFRDHRRGAHAVGVVVGGMALNTLLKGAFALPRPPPSVAVVETSGHTFPSGHVLGATVAYGTLAHDLRVSTARRRAAVAALVVAVVALTRVLLGVHFPRDVVAGVVFGLAYLAAAIALTRGEPRSAFALAVVLAAFAMPVSGPNQYAVAVAGTATGGLLAWLAVDAVPRVESDRGHVLLLGGFLPVMAVLGYGSTTLAVPRPAVFLATAAMAGLLLLGPHAAHRVR